MTNGSKFELSFNSEDDPDKQAIPLISVFLNVMEATTIPSGWKAGLAVLWTVSRLERRPGRDISALLPLTEIDWDWPDFDAMREWLVRDDCWPSPWHHYAAAAKDGRRKMKVERVKLLAASLNTAAKSQQFATAENISSMKTEGWTVISDSEPAMRYIKSQVHRVDIDDWRTWPPLFPGDQSRLVIGG